MLPTGAPQVAPSGSDVQRRDRTTPTPKLLWLLGAAVLIPVLAPLAALFVDIFGAGSAAWSVLASGRTAQLLANTIGLVVAVTAAAAVIGTTTAWLTERTALPGRRLWSTILALPLAVPSYVGALAIISASGPGGLVADLTGIGIPRMSGFIGAALVLTLFTYPYVHIMVGAALRGIDPSLEEVARGLGSTPSRVLRTILLPQLRPSLTASSLLVALYTLSDFGAVSLMRFDVFTRAIFTNYVGRIDRTPSEVLAGVMIVLALLVVAGEQRTRGRASYVTKKPRPGRRVELSGGRAVLALAFIGTIAFAAIAAPVAVLLTWLIRGLLAGQTVSSVWTEAGRSLLAAGAAGIVAVVAAVPVSVLAVRYRSRATRALEQATWAVYALPHITIGLALVLLTVRIGRPVYQSLFVLVLAYVAMFLPQASGAGQAALRQVDPHVEEAGRSLGSSQLTMLRRITVPMMSRGLVAGGALVFLTAMKELPATLLLRPTGFETLSVRIWAATSEGLYTRASAAALVLLVVAAIPLHLLRSRVGND